MIFDQEVTKNPKKIGVLVYKVDLLATFIYPIINCEYHCIFLRSALKKPRYEKIFEASNEKQNNR